MLLTDAFSHLRLLNLRGAAGGYPRIHVLDFEFGVYIAGVRD